MNHVFESADRAYQYLVESVMKRGVRRTNRTGVDTYAAFGLGYVLDISKTFPLLTRKKVHFKQIVAENIWFISGAPHVKDLKEHMPVWEKWADEDGFLETAYGRYWRRYPLQQDPDLFIDQRKEGYVTYRGVRRPYEPFANRDSRYVHIDDHGLPAFDQLAWAVDQLHQNPKSRRIHVVAWYPPNASASKLPPCHHSFTLSTIGGKLNIHVHQRSGDVPLGIPYNMAGYALIAHLIAREVGLTPGLMRHDITDAHIYEDQMEGMRELAKREPIDCPRQLAVADKPLFDLTLEDADAFAIIGYDHQGVINMPVAV